MGYPHGVDLFPRESGILLHVTSLPSRHGIGDLGPNAYNFVNFLEASGQRIWQMLPLGPVGHGDSPYQCYSAFAGYSLLISVDVLVEQGLLRADELNQWNFDPRRVDSGNVRNFKRPLLERAADRLPDSPEYREFLKKQAYWLEDYVLFMAIKQEQDGAGWMHWPEALRNRDARALEDARQRLAPRIETLRRLEFLFYDQFQRLKRYANERHVRIMGDIPIYVAHDSADVWANPDQFDLDEALQPRHVAGTPPDYFSKTGQLWGNPVFAWERQQKDGFAWWMRRLESNFETFDLVRLDHFRGFESYWAVPYGEKTAVNGKWLPTPGEAFFDTAVKRFGKLPLVAENLGDITPAVEALREKYQLPGMSVLLFAFGDLKANLFQPHRYLRETVAYTGTHDNDTVQGWWQRHSEDGEKQRQYAAEQEYAARYMRISNSQEAHWKFIEAVESSVANTAIVPLQDVLGLDNSARMNVPGVAEGNWSWRVEEQQLTQEHLLRLHELTRTYERMG